MSKLREVRALYKSFVETGEEIRVLQGLDLELEEGEKVAIVGESGVGKSTLLHPLGTLDRPSSGQVIYRDRDLASLDEETLSELRNREIGFVFQFHYLMPDFSALENVMLPALVQGWEWEGARKVAAAGRRGSIGDRGPWADSRRRADGGPGSRHRGRDPGSLISPQRGERDG